MKSIIWAVIFLINLSAIFGESGNTASQLKKVTLINRSLNFQKDTAVINHLTRSAYVYLTKKPAQYDKVKIYVDSALKICDRKDIEIPSQLHLISAEYHFATGDFRTASEEASAALKKSSDKKEFMVNSKTNIFFGRYYQRIGSFKESIECLDKAKDIAEKQDLKGIIPRCYLIQSTVYDNLGDITNFRKNLENMIKAGYRERDTISVTNGYYLLGTSFCGDSATSIKRNFLKADSLLRESLKISLPRKDSTFASLAYANTGWNFYLEKMYDSSLINYNRSLRYSMNSKRYFASANSLGNIGTIYRDLGEYEKSIKYYKKAIEQGKMTDDVYNLRWIYDDMSKMYLLLKDTSKAFLAYVQFKKYNDIYLIKSNSQGLADARVRYDAESHKREIELLSLRLKNNRILNYGFAGLVVLSLVFGMLLFKGSQLKSKKRISEMNHKISEITQANLRQQMNPHFIFNTLNSIQYYMYQHDKLATNNYLTKFSNLMRKVLDNSQHTSVPLSDELIALNLYLELESIRFKDKFEYRINIDEDIDPIMYKVPTMLIQPYVENSICHGIMPLEGKGIITIELKLNENYILCTIEDNGIGREAARERNLRREGNHNSLGTQITKSRLDLVNELYGTSLKTIYTDLKNENGESAGTRVEIHIPILT